jgi:uncharacterized damage-inducible protein DinB
MKELLIQYAKYNIWANKRVLDILSMLDDATLDKDIISSYRSLRLTVYHIWSAEKIWLDRLLLAEKPVWAESIFAGDFKEAAKNWSEASQQLLQFAARQFNDRSFEHVVEYISLQKQPFKSPVHAVLMQVFNHSTYHRGQLITMLRQAGVSKIPNTDFIIFSREVSK